MAMTKEQALALASARLRLQQQSDVPPPAGAQAQPEPEQPSYLDRVKRSAGITARGAATGLASLPLMVTDLAAYPINLTSRLMGKGNVLPNYQETFQRGMSELGLPEPQGNVERAQMAVSTGIGGGMSGVGIGQHLAQSTKPAVAGVGNILRSAPTSQMVAGGSGAGSSEFARQQGAGQTGQIAAGLAGGLIPGVASQRFLPQSMNPDFTPPMRPSQTAVKQGTLKAAQQEGYVVPPAATEGNLTGKVLSGLSGKAKTEQLARVKNQRVTDSLAKKAIGLPDDAPLDTAIIQGVRNEAYDSGYGPVVRAGTMSTDDIFNNAINTIKRKHAGQASSFPSAVRKDIADTLDSLKVGSFDSADAINQIKLLREQAKSAYSGSQQDRVLGRAYREAADALEDQIERGIVASGGSNADELLKGFRNARQLIAKTHTVEDAVLSGSGNVDAMKLARDLQKGAPLTGELKTIGAFANNFRESAGLPKGADANPFTVLDFTTMSGGAGMSGLAGPGALPLMLLPPARVGARYGILSGPGQAMFTQPARPSQIESLLFPLSQATGRE